MHLNCGFAVVILLRSCSAEVFTNMNISEFDISSSTKELESAGKSDFVQAL